MSIDLIVIIVVAVSVVARLQRLLELDNPEESRDERHTFCQPDIVRRVLPHHGLRALVRAHTSLPRPTLPHWLERASDVRSSCRRAHGTCVLKTSRFVTPHCCRLVERGYNHHLSSGLLPVLPLDSLGDGQPFADGPRGLPATIYTNASSPAASMQARLRPPALLRTTAACARGFRDVPPSLRLTCVPLLPSWTCGRRWRAMWAIS